MGVKGSSIPSNVSIAIGVQAYYYFMIFFARRPNYDIDTVKIEMIVFKNQRIIQLSMTEK